MSNFPAVHILLGCLTNPNEEEDDNAEKKTANSNRMLCNEYGRLNNCYDIQRILFDYGYKDVFIAILTLKNYKDLLDSIELLYLNKSKDSFVLFNLCDGLETDGYPGISILFEIEKRNLYFTGSNSFFYQITTSKPILKKFLQSKSIPTSPFVQIDPHDPNKSIDQAENLLSYPMIIKPSISYASLYISEKSVVNNREEALDHIERLFKMTDKEEEFFLEKYFSGHEYTVLILGDQSNRLELFPVLERIFHSNLKSTEKLLTFENYWSGYQFNRYMIQGENPYHSIPVISQEEIQTIAQNAYLALNGNGYARIDLRTEQDNIYVLEVNANCSIGFGNSTPVGQILEISSYTPAKFLHHLIQFAFHRNSKTYEDFNEQ